MEIKKEEIVKEIFEWAYCIIIAIILALIIRYYVGTPTVVQMASMRPTFQEGDRLILNRLAITLHSDFKRGEVITFEAPTSDYRTTNGVDPKEPVAKYEYEPTNWFNKFKYYVLDVGKRSYIKRVIGLPEDHIEIKNGNVYINGEIYVEDYLQEGVVTENSIFTDFTVPKGYLFVMGDNRSYSMDSRVFGCIPISKVESKACLRIWPLSKFGTNW